MKSLDTLGVELGGINLIEASAGTGKTYAISTLYLRFLLESKLSVEEILVVTYTRAATSELRDRIRSRIRDLLEVLHSGESEDELLLQIRRERAERGPLDEDDKRLRLALSSFDQAAIYTIHGFCQRALQDAAFESGASFDATLEASLETWIEEIACDLWAQSMYEMEPSVARYLRDKKLDLDTVRRLTARGLRSPELELIPERVEDVALDEAAMEAWRDGYRQCRELWREQREEIVSLLEAASGTSLNGTRYPKRSLRSSFAPAIDALFGGEDAVLPLGHKQAEKLRASVMAGLVKGKATAPSHELFDALDRWWSSAEAVAQSFEATRMALILHILRSAPHEADRRKRERGVLGFDDLLRHLRDGLRSPRGEALAASLCRQYPAALIDEFQDTDPVQYEIFQRVYGSRGSKSALFLIGDPKQAIYAFRGADLFTYLRAADDAAERSHTLDTNWRSDPGVIRGVNTLFDSAQRAFVYDKLGFAPVQASPRAKPRLSIDELAPLELVFTPRDGGGEPTETPAKGKAKAKVKAAPALDKASAQRAVLAQVCDDICELLAAPRGIEDAAIRPGDIAILVRKKRQALACQEALAERGVPSVLEGDSSVFDSREAEEIERLLRGIADAQDRRALRAALATDLLGYTASALDDLARDEERWQDEVQAFREWQSLWRERGFIQCFWHILDSRGVTRRLLQWSDGQRRITNIHHLAELLQAVAQGHHSGPEQLLRWLQDMRSDASARSRHGDESELRLESDDDAVKLVTIHKSKGLEYPLVYCPFLWDSGQLQAADKTWVKFHDPSRGYAECLDVGSEDKEHHLGLATVEALAEDLRLLYVALTRAVHRCSIHLGAFGGHEDSGLAYLLYGGGEAGSDPEALASWRKALVSCSDRELLERLEPLVSAGEGAIRLRSVESEGTGRYRADEGSQVELAARRATRVLESHQRSSSFSGLTQRVEHEQDHDAHTAGDHRHVESLDEGMASSGAPVPLATMPRGATAGQMIHLVFEHLDFQCTEAEEIRLLCRSSLASHGIERPGLETTLTETLPAILRTPLAPERFCLADIRKNERLDELEFNIPVRSRGILNAAMLADAMEARSAPPWPEDYPRALRSLDFKPLSGFLKGFMDLVFVHDGRFYLVDYKSNDLGERAEHYGATALQQSMAEHHYYLQYHLYLVALQRYLRLRLSNYDYEQHMGGVFYLYLRGMDPSHPAGCGVFYDRPRATEVDHLDDVLRGEARNEEARP